MTQPLYDSDTITTLVSTNVVFFDGTNVGGNRLLSNMDTAGLLPHPKFHRIGGFRLVPDANIIVAGDLQACTLQNEDIVRILYGSSYNLTIGSLKPYLEVPSFFIPAGVGTLLHAGDTTTTSYSLTNGDPVFGNFLKLRHWIALPPLQSFRASLIFPTAPTLNAIQRFWNFLDGENGREVM